MSITPTPQTAPDWAWRWPVYAAGSSPYPIDGGNGALRRTLLSGAASAAFVEWRYYAVLSDAFHGIVGLALVNPEQRFAAIAEGGLLLIIAGVLGPLPASTSSAPAELCWMHLFSAADCRFDRPGPGGVQAGDARCCIELRQSSSADAELQIESSGGLKLSMRHNGLSGSAIPPQRDAGLDGLTGRLLDSHWQVDCPSPVALCDGELTLTSGLLDGLPMMPGVGDSFASAALRERIGADPGGIRWQGASGYYEHSFGVRPLPLHGWDFLFVPDAPGRRSLVMQTYRGSDRLRYVDCCWDEAGRWRRERFAVDASSLRWAESGQDSVLGVSRPIRRLIETEANGLRLSVDNRILHRVPLLRPWRAAVRHFFISEEIGVCDWRLTDTDGRVLVEVRGQPCGGELAHRRWRVPRMATT